MLKILPRASQQTHKHPGSLHGWLKERKLTLQSKWSLSPELSMALQLATSPARWPFRAFSMGSWSPSGTGGSRSFGERLKLRTTEPQHFQIEDCDIS